jgi:hypothetical protein
MEEVVVLEALAVLVKIVPSPMALEVKEELVQKMLT